MQAWSDSDQGWRKLPTNNYSCWNSPIFLTRSRIEASLPTFVLYYQRNHGSIRCTMGPLRLCHWHWCCLCCSLSGILQLCWGSSYNSCRKCWRLQAATSTKVLFSVYFVICSFIVLISRQQTITQIATNSQPPAAPTTSWQNPNILPTSTYVPTKTFVKASSASETASAASGTVYDPSNAVMKLHTIAIHNHVVELYEKAETAIPGMHAVRLKLGEEVYAGVGTTYKLAKQDAATKALNETKMSKPSEKKTLKPRPVGITATQELHELATKKGLSPKFKFLEPYNFEFKPSMR